jgi:cytochrome c oxidase subunit 2
LARNFPFVADVTHRGIFSDRDKGMNIRLCPYAAILAAASLGACSGWQSALDPRAPQASGVSRLFWIFVAISAVIWILVTAILVVAILRGGRARGGPLNTNLSLERRAGRAVLFGAIATAVIVLALSVISYATQRTLFSKSPNALVVRVIGHQWWWQVQYDADNPDQSFETANEIRIPVGQPVAAKLETRDVIHSFWVPSLTGKMDLINGQQNEIQFTASRAGIYRGQCAEFCGLQHAHMAFTVVALPQDEFDRWRQNELAAARAPTDPRTKQGEVLFRARGCALCHTIRGTLAGGALGPDLTHIASRNTIAAGTLLMTTGALSAWIADPQRIKPGSLMPPSNLSSAEMITIVRYLESLQ